MKIGGQRILSFEFLIAALGLFIVMHLLPVWRDNDYLGWEWWVKLILVIMYDPKSLGDWREGLGHSSFLTLSLLIVVSPFLGNVWAKSFLAWSIMVSFSAVATMGFLFVFSFQWAKWSVGGWFMAIAPVLNFVGLLLARPQWLNRSGSAVFQKQP